MASPRGDATATFRAVKQRPRETPVRMGETLEVDVESLADGPDAMARVGAYVLFIAGALPGERVRVRVTSAGRKHGRADLVTILRRSPHRVGALCEHFGECGGCQFQHLAYDAQLEHKTARLAKQLAFEMRVPASALPIVPMTGPEEPWGQRNKIALHVRGRRGDVVAGLHRMRSREIIPIRDCPVQDEEGTRLAFAAVDAIVDAGIDPWRERDEEGYIRSVVVRTSRATGQSSVTIVSRRPRVPRLERVVRDLERAGATTIALNVNDRPDPALLGRETHVLSGRKRLMEEIEGIRYLSSPAAFFQTSAWGAAELVKKVRRLANPPKGARLIDLYSGGGLLSLALADRVREVIGIEENPSAVEDARASASLNGITNARFVAARSEHVVRELSADRTPTVVVLDPPREGCDRRVIEALARLKPLRVVYVSCEPQTLARDVAELSALGFDLKTVEPLDMFPHAYHVEAVAVLEPARANSYSRSRRR